MPVKLKAWQVSRLLTRSLLALLLVACQAAAGTSTSTTVAPVPTTGTTVTPSGSQVFEMLALATHPNGVQLRVERIELLGDSTVVSGSITNGSPYGISLDRGVTELAADTEQVARLIEGLPPDQIPPGAELDVALRFAPLANAGAVTLLVNMGGGSSRSDPSSSSPTIELGPIALDSTATRPDLPESIALLRTSAAPSGVELQVEGINFSHNRIGVWVRIANPGQVDASIAPTIAPSLLVDDLENRYPIVLPHLQGSMVVPAGTARSGVLSFAGRIHPDAKSLGLGLNAGIGGDTGDAVVVYPRLIVEGIPLTGDSVLAPLPDPLVVQAASEIPNQVRVEVGTLVFSNQAVSADLVISNLGASRVALASLPTLLIDDLETRYPLVAPTNNPQLVLDAGTTLEGTFAFSGRISDTATQVRLLFNAGGSAPSLTSPSLTMGPYLLVRPSTSPQTVAPRVFAVTDRSWLADDVLASSEVEQITQTLTQFGATEVEGGFRLTLPDSILFDFNSSELRADAGSALTLIADVLRYFEGDAVIVIGHTDSIGGASYNQRLSEDRAKSVVAILIADHGIAPDRLTAEGRGAGEPIAPNTNPDGEDNPDGRQLNRRVEIIVITERELPLP
jgi:outer membrane protein OmpA-like peptidoglycan-associated protein